jgi:hypothetical protein
VELTGIRAKDGAFGHADTLSQPAGIRYLSDF